MFDPATIQGKLDSLNSQLSTLSNSDPNDRESSSVAREIHAKFATICDNLLDFCKSKSLNRVKPLKLWATSIFENIKQCLSTIQNLFAESDYDYNEAVIIYLEWVVRQFVADCDIDDIEESERIKIQAIDDRVKESVIRFLSVDNNSASNSSVNKDEDHALVVNDLINEFHIIQTWQQRISDPSQLTLIEAILRRYSDTLNMANAIIIEEEKSENAKPYQNQLIKVSLDTTKLNINTATQRLRFDSMTQNYNCETLIQIFYNINIYVKLFQYYSTHCGNTNSTVRLYQANIAEYLITAVSPCITLISRCLTNTMDLIFIDKIIEILSETILILEAMFSKSLKLDDDDNDSQQSHCINTLKECRQLAINKRNQDGNQRQTHKVESISLVQAQQVIAELENALTKSRSCVTSHTNSKANVDLDRNPNLLNDVRVNKKIARNSVYSLSRIVCESQPSDPNLQQFRERYIQSMGLLSEFLYLEVLLLVNDEKQCYQTERNTKKTALILETFTTLNYNLCVYISTCMQTPRLDRHDWLIEISRRIKIVTEKLNSSEGKIRLSSELLAQHTNTFTYQTSRLQLLSNQYLQGGERSTPDNNYCSNLMREISEDVELITTTASTHRQTTCFIANYGPIELINRVKQNTLKLINHLSVYLSSLPLDLIDDYFQLYVIVIADVVNKYSEALKYLVAANPQIWQENLPVLTAESSDMTLQREVSLLLVIYCAELVFKLKIDSEKVSKKLIKLLQTFKSYLMLYKQINGNKGDLECLYTRVTQAFLSTRFIDIFKKINKRNEIFLEKEEATTLIALLVFMKKNLPKIAGANHPAIFLVDEMLLAFENRYKTQVELLFNDYCKLLTEINSKITLATHKKRTAKIIREISDFISTLQKHIDDLNSESVRLRDTGSSLTATDIVKKNVPGIVINQNTTVDEVFQQLDHLLRLQRFVLLCVFQTLDQKTLEENINSLAIGLDNDLIIYSVALDACSQVMNYLSEKPKNSSGNPIIYTKLLPPLFTKHMRLTNGSLSTQEQIKFVQLVSTVLRSVNSLNFDAVTQQHQETIHIMISCLERLNLTVEPDKIILLIQQLETLIEQSFPGTLGLQQQLLKLKARCLLTLANSHSDNFVSGLSALLTQTHKLIVANPNTILATEFSDCCDMLTIPIIRKLNLEQKLDLQSLLNGLDKRLQTLSEIHASIPNLALPALAAASQRITIVILEELYGRFAQLDHQLDSLVAKRLFTITQANERQQNNATLAKLTTELENLQIHLNQKLSSLSTRDVRNNFGLFVGSTDQEPANDCLTKYYRYLLMKKSMLELAIRVRDSKLIKDNFSVIKSLLLHFNSVNSIQLLAYKQLLEVLFYRDNKQNLGDRINAVSQIFHELHMGLHQTAPKPGLQVSDKALLVDCCSLLADNLSLTSQTHAQHSVIKAQCSELLTICSDPSLDKMIKAITQRLTPAPASSNKLTTPQASSSTSAQSTHPVATPVYSSRVLGVPVGAFVSYKGTLWNKTKLAKELKNDRESLSADEFIKRHGIDPNMIYGDSQFTTTFNK